MEYNCIGLPEGLGPQLLFLSFCFCSCCCLKNGCQKSLSSMDAKRVLMAILGESAINAIKRCSALTYGQPASAITAQAQQFGGYGGYDGGRGPFGGDSGSSGSSSASDSGSGFNGFRGGAPFDISSAQRVRAIHGILGALAFVVLFPGGSILIRVLPGRFALWAHALGQVVSLVVFIATVALGVRLVREVQIPFGDGTIVSTHHGSPWRTL
jgi:hypothetical protein